MSDKICIVNYGLGNLGSIQNMYKRLGIAARISTGAQEVEEADKLILPGVGAFDEAIKGLAKSGLIDVLNRKVLQEKTPVLGVCLGMQLLTRRSDEGAEKGLCWIEAETKRFSFAPDTAVKVPHMGWNEVCISRRDDLVRDLNGENEAARFYFVHSYYVECDNPEDVLMKASHGIEFAAAFRREHIMGVQFHPEKSHKFGMRILKNFYDL